VTIIAVSGGGAPEATGPQGACSIDRSAFVYRRHPLAADPKPTVARHGGAAEPTSQSLQRIRERLELAAIAAGCRYPEQTAAALLREGVGL